MPRGVLLSGTGSFLQKTESDVSWAVLHLGISPKLALKQTRVYVWKEYSRCSINRTFVTCAITSWFLSATTFGLFGFLKLLMLCVGD